ncbi:protein S100-A8-like [Sebastes fasciatus]|uniref:protein S100-A8-like n=1 Tax=Sebastes fasciatus TaxID=394691 RepID=UPI003D9E71F1
MAQEMTALEVSVVAMFGVFMQHQNAEGKMTRDQFSSMVKTELGRFIKDDTELFSDIDLDKDGFVSFKEFAVLVCTIAGCQHEVLQKAMEEQQKAKE